MNLRDKIYDALQESHGLEREVTIDDVIRVGCLYRHYLRLHGAPAKPDRPQDILTREIAQEVRTRFFGYIKDTFKNRIRPGRYGVIGNISYRLDGFLDDMLVDIAPVSTVDYNPAKPPAKRMLSAALKGYEAGVDKVLLIVVDRDKQDWSFWRIEGDFEKATKILRGDIGYINKLLAGEGNQSAAVLASEATCRRCPYGKSKACHMPATSDPHPYTVEALTRTPALEERSKVDSFLWSLNSRPSRRKRNVIHPSEFSITDCDRRIAYGLMGTEEHESIDPKLRRIFDTGHACHDVVQAVVRWAVPKFREEVRVYHDKLRITGHCDGDLGDDDGLEIKSIGSNGFSKLKKAKKDHEKQATIYGVLLDLQNIQYVYVNKETGDLAVFKVPIDRQLWHKMAVRAGNIVRTAKEGILPPRIKQEYKCRGCKYAWTCRPKAESGSSKPRTLRRFTR